MQTQEIAQPSTEKVTTSDSLDMNSLGVALAISYFAIMLWAPAVIPDYVLSAGGDLEMHYLRIILLLGVVLVYGVVQFFPAILNVAKLKGTLFTLAVLVSPIALVGALIPDISLLFSQNPILIYAAWFVTGLAVAILMLIWGYDMGARVSQTQSLTNIAASCIISGLLFSLTFALQKTAVIVITMLLPLLMLLIRLFLKANHSSADIAFVKVTNVVPETPVSNKFKALTGGRAALLVFCYGLVMGVAGAVGTNFAIMNWSVVYIGAAVTLAGVVMLAMLRTGKLASDRRVVIAFFPASLVCMFLFSVGSGAVQIIPLFIVYFGVNVFNVLNTGFIGETSADAPKIRYTKELFTSEFRTVDMLAAAVGWAAATAFQFFVPQQYVPYCYFLLAVVIASIATLVFMPNDEGKTPSDEEHKKSMDSIMVRWEDICVQLAEEYKLSSREREILLLLSRGRDRQYIHDILCIAPSTVRTHTYNIYRKMEIHSQQQLIDEVENRFSQSYNVEE